jgi:integrase
LQPPAPGEVARVIAAADELTPPSFAAFQFTTCYSAIRAGELDALMLDDLDFTPSAETIHVQRHWNVKAKKLTPPKHAPVGKMAMVEPLRERLLTLPRERQWAFTTLRGHHYVPNTRNHHRNRVRAAVGLGNTSLDDATRHYSRGTCSTCSSCPTTWWRRSCGTRAAARLSASSTGTRARRWRASGSALCAATNRGRRAVAVPARSAV